MSEYGIAQSVEEHMHLCLLLLLLCSCTGVSGACIHAESSCSDHSDARTKRMPAFIEGVRTCQDMKERGFVA